MSAAREDAAAAVFDGKLYVMGGRDGQNELSSVEQYDQAKNEWVAMASMALNTGTYSLRAVSL